MHSLLMVKSEAWAIRDPLLGTSLHVMPTHVKVLPTQYPKEDLLFHTPSLEAAMGGPSILHHLCPVQVIGQRECLVNTC